MRVVYRGNFWYSAGNFVSAIRGCVSHRWRGLVLHGVSVGGWFS